MSEKDIKVPFVELSAEELEKVALELQEKDKEQNETADKLLTQEIELNKKAKELDKKEKELTKKSAAPKSVKPEPGLEFEFEDNQKYKFEDWAPQKISINGKGYSQKEIAENEDLALQLIGGNSGLIIKI